MPPNRRRSAPSVAPSRRGIRPRPAEKPPRESRWKRLVRKPGTWLGAVVVGALALFFSDYIRAFLGVVLPLDAVEQAGGPAIEIVDVHTSRIASDFVLPNGVTDEQLADWDRTKGPPDDDWLAARGAVSVGTAKWEITLEGQRTEQVVVTDMTPKLVGACTDPLTGDLIENRPQGEGEKFHFDVAIDAPNPQFHVTEPDGTSYPYFETKTITLPRGEKNVIAITANTAGPHCRWTVEVDYLADGKRGHLSILAPDGKPFELTGPVEPSAHDSIFVQFGCAEPYARVAGSDYAAREAAGSSPCGA